VVSSLTSINEVNPRWARLVLRWVTVSRFNILVYNQPPKNNSAIHHSRVGKMITSFGWDSKGRYGSFVSG